MDAVMVEFIVIFNAMLSGANWEMANSGTSEYGRMFNRAVSVACAVAALYGAGSLLIEQFSQ